MVAGPPVYVYYRFVYIIDSNVYANGMNRPYTKVYEVPAAGPGRTPLRSAALRIHEQHFELLKNSPLGLSEEARRRIERSFLEDQIEPHTREVAAAIVRLAEAVKDRVGAEWHVHPRAFEAFIAAVSSRLLRYRCLKTPSELKLLVDQADDMPTVGRMIEREDLRLHLQAKDSDLQSTDDPSEPTVEMLRCLVEALDGTGISEGKIKSQKK
jgi:hypothetical protein